MKMSADGVVDSRTKDNTIETALGITLMVCGE